MSKVMKEDGTKRLINQILASLRVGKIAIMDKALNINSSNPVENKIITASINGLNNTLNTKAEIVKIKLENTTVSSHDFCTWQKNLGEFGDFVIIGFEVGSGGTYTASPRFYDSTTNRVYPNAYINFKSQYLNQVTVYGYNETDSSQTLNGWLYLARIIEEV